MLSKEEEKEIAKRAYVPEQLPHYFKSISGLEADIIDDYIYYFKKGDTLSFIGYSLKYEGSIEGMEEALKRVVKLVEPAVIRLETSKIPKSLPYNFLELEEDNYWRLELQKVRIDKKLRSLIKRAERELEVKHTSFKKEHQQILEEFLRRKKMEEIYERLYKRIPDFVTKCKEAILLSCYKKTGELVAYTIADNSSLNYSFYLFNITTDKKTYVPGASDLLFKLLLEDAKLNDKKFVNMGLGVNKGIEKFKEKWGSKPFIKYYYAISRLKVTLETEELYRIL